MKALMLKLSSRDQRGLDASSGTLLQASRAYCLSGAFSSSNVTKMGLLTRINARPYASFRKAAAKPSLIQKPTCLGLRPTSRATLLFITEGVSPSVPGCIEKQYVQKYCQNNKRQILQCQIYKGFPRKFWKSQVFCVWWAEWLILLSIPCTLAGQKC